MDDTDNCCDFPYLQGVDLTLWLQIVVGVLALVAGGALLVALTG